jgi:hypothetical protein
MHFFSFCKMIIFMDYWWTITQLCHFISKRGLKVVKILEILRIWKVHRLILSKLDAVSFFDWKLLKTNCTERANNFLFFHYLILILFILKMLLFMSYPWINTENELLWFYRKWLNVSQIMKFHLHGRWTQLMFFI